MEDYIGRYQLGNRLCIHVRTEKRRAKKKESDAIRAFPKAQNTA